MNTYEKYLPKTEAAHPLLARNMKVYKKVLDGIMKTQGMVGTLESTMKRNQDFTQWLGDIKKILSLLDDLEYEISHDFGEM